MASIAAGAAFGASLAISGVFQPDVIFSQLRLENWHMMQSYMTAMASSALCVAVAQRAKYLGMRPRGASSLGLFGTYDGNIVGGALLGAGMALSGACPGTVLAQTAVGTRSGLYALGGATFAGLIWTRFLQPAIARASKSCPDVATPIYDTLGISPGAGLLGLEAMCAAVVVASTYLNPVVPESCVHPIIGGVAIGAAQLLSIALRKALLGTSTLYVEMGNWFWWVVEEKGDGQAPSNKSVLFSTGVVGGAWALSQAWPACAGAGSAIEVEPSVAFAGGLLMAIGSRMAGGCTSGHGISGAALLSTSSFVTIASMFISGVAVVNLVY